MRDCGFCIKWNIRIVYFLYSSNMQKNSCPSSMSLKRLAGAKTMLVLIGMSMCIKVNICQSNIPRIFRRYSLKLSHSAKGHSNDINICLGCYHAYSVLRNIQTRKKMNPMKRNIFSRSHCYKALNLNSCKMNVLIKFKRISQFYPIQQRGTKIVWTQMKNK